MRRADLAGVAPAVLAAVLAGPAPARAPQDAPASAAAQVPAWEAHIEPASEEPALALAELELAEGLRAELFAAEPMLANPVCLYVDHDGGVFVAETFRHFEGVTDMREHPTWLDEDLASRTVGDRLAMMSRHEGEAFDAYGRATDRVRWLADTDGDGRADVDTVFAEGFTAHEAGIGAGLLVHGSDVYYTCIPSLWRLRDEDGNRRAEVREELSTGYGVNIALLGHDLHGLRIGPDGRLYFSSGDRGFHVQTEDGVLAHPHTGAVLRCELDGSGLEVFATGLRNPQELVFDELGNLWTGDNNSDGGDKARWVHVVEGSDSGWRYSYQWLTDPVLRGPWNDEKLWHPHHPGQAAYLLPPVANLASGPSGLTYDRGTGLPARYARHFFLCDFRGDPAYSGIHAFTVEPRGAGWELGPVEWMLRNGLPTDVDFGPDGSLYVSDWVNGWDKPGKGRVFRIFDPEALAPDTAELLQRGAGSLDGSDLGALLAHPDQRVRQLAQLELAERGASEELFAAAGSAPTLLGRLHGLWGLGQLGDGRVADFLADGEAELRVSACRILGDLAADGAERPGHALLLLEALEDPQPRVRMHAAIALGRCAGKVGFDGLVQLLRAEGSDPVMRHAAVEGLIGQGAPERLLALAGDPAVDVRLGAVVALRRLGDARVSAFLDDPDPLVVLETARAIHDVPLPTALGELAALAEAPRLAGAPSALGRRVVNANHHVHDRDAAKRLLTLAVDAAVDDDLRVEALARLAEWSQPGGRDAVTGAWRPISGFDLEQTEYLGWMLAGAFSPQLVTRESAAVQLGWVELLNAVETPTRLRWFEDLAVDERADEALRLRALELLADAAPERLVETLEQALFSERSGVRAKALELAAAADAEGTFPLIEAAATRGALSERRAAYGLLGEAADPRAGSILAEQLRGLLAGEVPAEAALELVRAAEARRALEGGELVAPLLEARTAGRTDPVLSPYLDALHGGAAERGRELFMKRADLSCLRCHTTGEEAEQLDRPAIGPTLAGLGGRATRLDNLTSIVDPNRAITGGFQGTLFFLEGGERVEGQVLEESAELVRVLDADGVEHAFAPAEVEVRRRGLSAMPEGLDKLLTPEQMRDLLEFLSGL